MLYERINRFGCVAHHIQDRGETLKTMMLKSKVGKC